MIHLERTSEKMTQMLTRQAFEAPLQIGLPDSINMVIRRCARKERCRFFTLILFAGLPRCCYKGCSECFIPLSH